MSASPDNPVPSAAPHEPRSKGWNGLGLLLFGALIGAGSMFFFRRPAEPTEKLSPTGPLAADAEFLPAASGPASTHFGQPTPAQPPSASAPALDPEDPFADVPGDARALAAIPSETAPAILSEVPAPAEDAEGGVEIEVAPADDEAAAAARLAHAGQVSEELRRLTESQREAQAELAAELAAHVDDPPSGLLDQLDAGEQLLAARLANIETLADRIQTQKAWIARLQQLAESLDADPHKRDRLAVRAFLAQAKLALAKEQHRGERTPAEVAVLAEEVRDLDKLHRKVCALYIVGAAGGESEKWARTGYYLCHARADLELATGNRPAALAEMHKARLFVETEISNLTICASECVDGAAFYLPNAVARRGVAFTRWYELARLLGDQAELDWAKKENGS